MNNNIIFVDFDGVLLPGKFDLFNENRRTGKDAIPYFDPFAVRTLNLLAKYSNAKIVFSTSWGCFFSEDELKHICKYNGLGFDYHENCMTPKKFNSNHYHEIIMWLDIYAEEGDRFIAIDDDTSCRYFHDFFRGQLTSDFKYYGEWIATDFDNGISLQNFYDGCRVLNIDLEDLMEKEFGIKKLTTK